MTGINDAQDLSLGLSTDSQNAKARTRALEAGAQVQCEPSALINFSSAGSVYVLGAEDTAHKAAGQLAKHSQLNCIVVSINESRDQASIKLEIVTNNGSETQIDSLATLLGRISAISGHLGHFDIRFETPKEIIALQKLLVSQNPSIDIILDLTDLGYIASEIKPPGYYAPGASDVALQQALQEIPELVGEFEKPQYFLYDSSICAHGRSGIKACTRCIDTCPTDAISSNNDSISVDANLCQGAGSCATACPTGAITYSYPQLSDTLQRIHAILQAYQNGGGQQSVLLFHDASFGRDKLANYGGRVPDSVIPIEIEELGSVGMDVWFASLAYGATRVILFATPQTATSVLKEIESQINYSVALLQGMGLSAECIKLVYAIDASFISALAPAQSTSVMPVAGFFESNKKRKVIRAAVDHLYQHAPAPRPLISLPTSAPFGEVLVDTKRCTLCMACVWQCPANALVAGGNLPQLKFVENDCVQCGICSRTCPEDAIGPSPRYLYDQQQAKTARILYEEQPFLCIKCDKAFASQRVIETMIAKLKQHAMFKGAALQRIKMCEDCRVKDIYAQEPGQNEEHIPEEN